MAGLLHWFRSGDELPHVLLHGFTGAAASWTEVASALDGPVAALHLPGHHPEAPVADGWHANIAWVVRTLGSEGITRCRLVGYSLGARVALGVAAAAADLVAELVLIGVHPGLASETERDQRRRADAVWIERLRRDGLEAFVAAWEALPLFATQSAETRAGLRAIRLAHDPDALAASLEHMGLAEMPCYAEALATLPVPVTLIAGERDTKFRQLAAASSRDVIIVPGCGHNVVAEAPGAVADVLELRAGR